MVSPSAASRAAACRTGGPASGGVSRSGSPPFGSPCRAAPSSAGPSPGRWRRGLTAYLDEQLPPQKHGRRDVERGRQTDDRAVRQDELDRRSSDGWRGGAQRHLDAHRQEGHRRRGGLRVGRSGSGAEALAPPAQTVAREVMTALELGARETAVLKRMEQATGLGGPEVARTTTRLGLGGRSWRTSGFRHARPPVRTMRTGRRAYEKAFAGRIRRSVRPAPTFVERTMRRHQCS